jgi:hypothetical protein
MDKLDYELHHASGVSPRENEIVFIPENQVSGKEEQEKVIEFSKKIVGCIDDIIKNYNSKYSKKIKLSQAKKMYCAGARMHETGSPHSANEWGLARLNLCMRIIAGEIGELNLDISRKTSYNKLVDMTDQLTPSEEDFKKAELDARNYDLDYHFVDIDELYIDSEPVYGLFN